MKNGFTLVELSIVLVIIGLLIGGILIGQSLIDSARIQQFVRQLNQYDAAVMLFEDKYRGLPGDSSTLYSGGNNDGLIDDDTPDGDLYFNDEIANFWYSLSLTGFNPDNIQYDTDGSSGVRAGVHVPEIEGLDDVLAIPYYASGGSFGNTNAYLITKFDNSDAFISDEMLAAMSPSFALSVDSKLDDGNGNSGYIQAIPGNGFGLTDCNDIMGTGNYQAENSDQESCVLLIYMSKLLLN